MKTIIEQDTENFANSFKLKNSLRNASFIITGATGLIGSTLIRCLLSSDDTIKIYAPVRNIEKAESVFNKDYEERIFFKEGDLLELLENIDGDYDYIVHCASPTNGKYMITNPVETYMLSLDSTRLLLDYCRWHQVKSMVYVSSIEYYGQIYNDSVTDENSLGYINYDSPRSCYPIAKRATEYLCKAYALEFGVPVKIARLTQTFGPGIAKDDHRVFAQFARSIKNQEDIVLHTTGDSAKPYCYTTDCINALLHILLKGDIGQSYNVANENTYITIKELAEYLCARFNPNLKVRVELNDELGYAPTTKLRLNTDKLKSLGWRPIYSLSEMFERLIKSL